MTTIEMLDEMAELMAQKDALEMRKQDLIDSVLTDEIKAQLKEIDEEFAFSQLPVTAKIDALGEEIKSAVLEGGASAKGKYLQAVYSKGRVTWDSKILDELFWKHPELLKARKEGAASVSIRKAVK